MHELCEFPRGSGFDAHLNIEQMNKASSHLFKMYDDARKAARPAPSETEFRGYYALLKIDRHPGFKVGGWGGGWEGGGRMATIEWGSKNRKEGGMVLKGGMGGGGLQVEPAELARDLVSMAPPVRSSPQVRFAREVARSAERADQVGRGGADVASADLAKGCAWVP